MGIWEEVGDIVRVAQTAFEIRGVSPKIGRRTGMEPVGTPPHRKGARQAPLFVVSYM